MTPVGWTLNAGTVNLWQHVRANSGDNRQFTRPRGAAGTGRADEYYITRQSGNVTEMIQPYNATCRYLLLGPCAHWHSPATSLAGKGGQRTETSVRSLQTEIAARRSHADALVDTRNTKVTHRDRALPPCASGRRTTEPASPRSSTMRTSRTDRARWICRAPSEGRPSCTMTLVHKWARAVGCACNMSAK